MFWHKGDRKYEALISPIVNTNVVNLNLNYIQQVILNETFLSVYQSDTCSLQKIGKHKGSHIILSRRNDMIINWEFLLLL